MTTCGYIGLGVMGRPMVRNLLRAGHEVVVYNRSPGPVEEMVAAGAVAAPTPRAVAERADIVFTCVSDSVALRAVVLGEGAITDDGALDGAATSATFIDFSTVDPATARDVARICGDRGVMALDAPVSGGEQGAIDGTLSIMVGGDPQGLRRAQGLLDVIGSTVRHVGPPGAGQTVKAANQLLVGGQLALVAEALLLLEGGDIDLEAALAVLGGGLAGSTVLQVKARPMLDRRFPAGARANLHRKDLRITLDLAREAGVPLPVTAVVAQLFEALEAMGMGKLDHSAVFALLARLAGRPDGDATGPR